MKREYMTGLSLTSYIMSKILVLGLFRLIQSVLIAATFSLPVGLPDGGLFAAPFIELLITMFLTAAASTANLNNLRLKLQQEGITAPHEAEDFFEFTFAHILKDRAILIAFVIVFLLIAGIALSKIERKNPDKNFCPINRKEKS